MDPSSESTEMFEVKFRGAVNIKIANITGGTEIPRQVYFQVSDVRSNQLEGICFYVEDFEHEIISFHCREIQTLEKITPA